MKNIIASFIFVITALCTLAQAPQSFNYQAVLRDAAGNILGNKDVEIQVKILQGSASGSAIFSETHSTTTNNFGLVNLSVGSISSTDLSNIDWTDGPFFIQISVDGTVMGTSQLLSVPFAMHAISVENDAVEDDDANPENEIQVLSINADTIFLSSGGFVVLPPEIDPAFTSWDKSSGITISESQISDLKHFTGDSITGNETAFDGWDKNANDDFTTADETDPVFSNSLAAAITAADTARWASNNDIQNELQNLSIENQQLSISGGNTIDLSDAYYIADSSATNELQDISLNGTQLSISKGSTVDLAEVQDGDKQRLSLGVTNQHDIRLNISNANFVEMPFVKDGVSKYNWSEAENYVAKWGQYGAMVKSTIFDNGNIGIGTENPDAKLEVAGQVKITGGQPGTDKILVSDENGLASWKTNLDNDPTNELQTISRSGLTVTLNRNGGTFRDSILTETDVDNMVSNNGYQLAVDDGDTDSTNELNSSITLNNTDLEVTDAGGTITTDLSSLIDDADADPTNEIQNISQVLTKGNNAGAKNLVNLGNVGIGVSDPDAKLEVNGQIKITGGSPGVNKVLSSDTNGLASWKSISQISKKTLMFPVSNFSDDVTGGGSSLEVYSGWKYRYVKVVEGKYNGFLLSFPVPKDYTGTSMTVRVVYSSDSGTGNFYGSILYSGLSEGQAFYNGNSLSGIPFTEAAPEAYHLAKFEKDIPVPSSKEYVYLMFTRKGNESNDTCTGNMMVFAVAVDY